MSPPVPDNCSQAHHDLTTVEDSTCDLRAVVNDGLSAASKEQLKGKTGEEIVDADIAAQMKK